MAKATRYNIVTVAGDDLILPVRLLDADEQPIDTTGFVFTAQVRDGFLPDAALVESFTVSPIAGGAVISLTGEQTAPMVGRKLFWDLQSDSGIIRTWLTGTFTANPEVTE